MIQKGAGGDCAIALAPIGRIGRLARGRRLVTITDARVEKLHSAKIPEGEVIVIGRGERSKTLATVEKVYERFSELEIDRSAMVVGMGGGLVCDIAGYAAATYHRGLDLCLAPTTLLAQADAAIGGKSGVNLRGYKNQIGIIRQPTMVVCDVAFLKTLSGAEMGNGLAEVVKHGAIASLPLLRFAESSSQKILAREPSALRRIVADSIAVKCAIVQRDENESGERTKLNFGHTVGHALEKVCRLPHGNAVAIGMAVEARMAVSMGNAARSDMEKLDCVLGSLGLPTSMPRADKDAICDAISMDKKRRGVGIMMPVLSGLGKCTIVRANLEDLREALGDAM
ncbi:MAG: 3-dehydroquinate synthase [Methanobacteriota archaeon]